MKKQSAMAAKPSPRPQSKTNSLSSRVIERVMKAGPTIPSQQRGSKKQEFHALLKNFKSDLSAERPKPNTVIASLT